MVHRIVSLRFASDVEPRTTLDSCDVLLTVGSFDGINPETFGLQ